ncbi:Methyltransferase domain-containing protein [Rhizobiales bacterium GAS191]|nr:Methyltransferase domain-containing protein [Rhizobiales bacterium GAS188]SEE55064.1 Methyltransferase domain-containing protein [Rhizobiales bacterium GAS191]
MSMPRQVSPELLDALPASDPRAIHSRRDLKRLNTIMLQTNLMARALTGHCADGGPRRILELGAGDGTFMLRLARRLASRWPNVKVTLLDRQEVVSLETRKGFDALGWQVETVTADVFDYLERTPSLGVDIVTANLFLHHFSQEQLARLFTRTAPICRLFAACEPRRSALALLGSRLTWAIGCNDVTRHDAVVSVRAGFRGAELSGLWPQRPESVLHEGAAGLFTHCFVARRVEGAEQG